MRLLRLFTPEVFHVLSNVNIHDVLRSTLIIYTSLSIRHDAGGISSSVRA